MKVLTVCQPYAELIARGLKPIENRRWPTAYRGPLAIHAGKSRSWLDPDDLEAYPAMVFGAVIATATLVACLKLEAMWPSPFNALQSHEHAEGPWCWILADVSRLAVPLPWKGQQGLFDVDLTRASLRIPCPAGGGEE